VNVSTNRKASSGRWMRPRKLVPLGPEEQPNVPQFGVWVSPPSQEDNVGRDSRLDGRDRARLRARSGPQTIPQNGGWFYRKTEGGSPQDGAWSIPQDGVWIYHKTGCGFTARRGVDLPQFEGGFVALSPLFPLTFERLTYNLPTCNPKTTTRNGGCYNSQIKGRRADGIHSAS
jgi:hypothetical protein